MSKILTIFLLSLCLAWGSTPVQADGSRIDDFERYKTSNETVTVSNYDLMMTRLIGTYEGIGWINAMHDEEGKPRIFCPPSDFIITTDYLRNMLDEEIRVHSFSAQPYPGDLPMDAVVLFAMLSRFPCQN